MRSLTIKQADSHLWIIDLHDFSIPIQTAVFDKAGVCRMVLRNGDGVYFPSKTSVLTIGEFIDVINEMELKWPDRNQDQTVAHIMRNAVNTILDHVQGK